jgi:hypothetical protein
MSQQGRLHSWRVRWLGEPDAVAEQLRDIARQGSSMARLAHACAFLLIVLFSAGSLVALGGDALASIATEWQAGRLDIPAAISVGVSTLMVLAMDVGMVYAASMLRLLNSRNAEDREKRVHQLVIAVVAILEAATYGYMSWRYEHPATWAAWALILARAFAAPLLSVYLSMARPLPVTSRDILYQAELAAGQGVIRDVVEVASDAGAPLAEKMALYGAAATMSQHDRARLDGMIEAVQQRAERPASHGTSGRGVITPTRPPTGPGSPSVASSASQALPDGGNVLQLPAPRRTRRAAAQGNATQVTRRPRRRGVSQSVEPQARAAWDAGARSIAALQREAGIGRAAAQKYAARFAAEESNQQLAQ